jgi:serine/threonine-protein kinase
MGEVYRAHDPTLRREVAIKVVSPRIGPDPEQLRRFEREAQLLAALNHPHIGAIYGVEEAVGQRALVLELVEGQTLADRLKREPLAIGEALAIARQICDALEAAHGKGIVHRDLKPANIKVTPAGIVKVLDFGLAKIAGEPGEASRSGIDDLTNSPTVTRGLTGLATLLGTAPYMSPEQASGLAVDERTDIWAFGCVLYEMLTGRRAFDGATTMDVIAAILEKEPDWKRLPKATPPAIRRLLERCLVKDQKRRLRDIGDAGLDVDEGLLRRAANDETRGQASRVSNMRWVAALALSVLATGVVVWNLKPRTSPTQVAGSVARVAIVPAVPLAVESEGILAVSPDGRRLAYVAGRGESARLYLRDLDRLDSKAIPGTNGAEAPSFSPDGRWIAFGADGKIKKVALDGGDPLVLCDVPERRGLGLHWGNDDVYFDKGPGTGIWRVPASGGTPTAVTSVSDQENYHEFPVLLPDGDTLIFSANLTSEATSLNAQSLRTGRRKVIGVGVGVGYLPSGHLIYVNSGTAFAVSFDLGRLEAVGAPLPALQRVAQTSLGTPRMAVSPTGSMAYIGADAGLRDTLTWVDRSGVEQPTGAPGASYLMPRLAPDGRRVAAVVGGNDATGAGDIWLYDLSRETLSRVTFNGGSYPTWTPDGVQLVYAATAKGVENVYLKSFEGAGLEQLFFGGVPGGNRPFSWSPDGHVLVFVSLSATTGNDLMVVERGDKPQPRPFLQTRFREGAPVFSPDGQWVAYASDKSGRIEIYMRPFPGPGAEWMLSRDGGIEPMWVRRTGELIYRKGDAMMSVDVTPTPTLTVGKPRKLFEGQYGKSGAFYANFDVTPDGQRLLMVKRVEREGAAEINLVLNWPEEIRRLVPSGARNTSD